MWLCMWKLTISEEILIWFLDYFNIFALCEQFWKIRILGPLLRQKGSPWVPFLPKTGSPLGPLEIWEQCIFFKVPSRLGLEIEVLRNTYNDTTFATRYLYHFVSIWSVFQFSSLLPRVWDCAAVAGQGAEEILPSSLPVAIHFYYSNFPLLSILVFHFCMLVLSLICFHCKGDLLPTSSYNVSVQWDRISGRNIYRFGNV